MKQRLRPHFRAELDSGIICSCSVLPLCDGVNRHSRSHLCAGLGYCLTSTLAYVSESVGVQNWEAVESGVPESDRRQFYINVCHRVLQQGAASGCPKDAAICARGQLQILRTGGTCQKNTPHECLFMFISV